MNLDDAQKKTVAGWIEAGLKLSDIQKRISTDFGLPLTYMEVRILVDDLKLLPKDPTPPPAPKEPEAPAKTVPGPMPDHPKPAATPLPSGAGGGLLGGKVTVGVDALARPGTMVSGHVTFSDGQKGAWYLDQSGRLGVAPDQQGYKPSAADVQMFQAELEKELVKLGL